MNNNSGSSITNAKIYISIPAYNEAKVIGEVIQEIKAAGYENIIIVDDGSKDETWKKSKEAGVISLRHKINRGKGAATKTAIEAAKLLGADIIVTMDADGQHDPKDIAQVIQPILEGKCEVVLGTRKKDTATMPLIKVFYNHIGNIITGLLFGLWVKDSQSGFRAYSKQAANTINTYADRYDYESEVIREIYRHKLSFAEVPIGVRYTHYSMTKAQKQSFVNGVKTVLRMIWKLLF